jgi:hypothetical protein
MNRYSYQTGNLNTILGLNLQNSEMGVTRTPISQSQPPPFPENFAFCNFCSFLVAFHPFHRTTSLAPLQITVEKSQPDLRSSIFLIYRFSPTSTSYFRHISIPGRSHHREQNGRVDFTDPHRNPRGASEPPRQLHQFGTSGRVL